MNIVDYLRVIITRYCNIPDICCIMIRNKIVSFWYVVSKIPIAIRTCVPTYRCSYISIIYLKMEETLSHKTIRKLIDNVLTVCLYKVQSNHCDLVQIPPAVQTGIPV